MEVELPSMPLSIRQNYQARLQSSKQGLEKIKRTIVRHSTPECQTDLLTWFFVERSAIGESTK